MTTQAPNANDLPSRCLSVPQLAEYLGLSRASICRALKSGKFRHRRIGGRVLFAPSDVQKIISEAEFGPRRRRGGSR